MEPVSAFVKTYSKRSLVNEQGQLSAVPQIVEAMLRRRTSRSKHWEARRLRAIARIRKRRS